MMTHASIKLYPGVKTALTINKGWLVEAYAAVAEALDSWEPELRLIRTQVVAVQDGHVSLRIICEYLPEGRVVTLDGIVV